MSNTKSSSDGNSWKSRLRDKRARNHDSPIRIINIPFLNLLSFQTKKQYRRKLFIYTWNGLCQVFIGAVNMAVIIYAVLHPDLHAALCCIGQHFFIALGILSRNRYNGWSLAYKPSDSKLLHVILQLTGVILSLCGTVYMFVNRAFSVTVHGIAGVIAMAACLITMLVGTCAIFSQNIYSEIHRWSGAFTFFLNSVGLISGILRSAFVDWAGYFIVVIVIMFVVIYSIFIIYFTLTASIKKIKMKRRLDDMVR